MYSAKIALVCVATFYFVEPAFAQPTRTDNFCDDDQVRVWLDHRAWSRPEEVDIFLWTAPPQESWVLSASVVFYVDEREPLGIGEKRQLTYGMEVGENVRSDFRMALETWRNELRADAIEGYCSHCAEIVVWSCPKGEFEERRFTPQSDDYEPSRGLLESSLDILAREFGVDLEWRDPVLTRASSRPRAIESVLDD
jgi:hypothetical protein